MSRLIAALAMYDWPEIAAANDALWTFIAGRLRQANIAAPERLNRDLSYDQPWRSPDLLLAQTCGYPFARELRRKVQLAGTPSYGVPGCEQANYCSFIIANRRSGIGSLGDLGRATVAVNSPNSQSGYWALRAAIALTAGAISPKRAILSSGHRQSLRLVAAGSADLAAIDAVCWAHAKQFEQDAVSQLQVIGCSPSAPGLPLITSLATPPATIEALRRALAAAITERALTNSRQALHLTGFHLLPEAAYDRILELRRAALTVPFPPLKGSSGQS